MRVKNLNGTSDDYPPSGYSSWKAFYVGRTGRWPSSCGCVDCSRTADVGGHVKKAGSYDFRHYIIPLCYYHNNQFGQELEVVGDWLEPINR